MKKRVVRNLVNLIEVIDETFNNGIVYLPRSVMERTDIGNDTKFIFGVAFDECASKINSEKYIKQAVNVIRNYLKTIETETIENDIECTPERAREVKKELSVLADEIDFQLCFENCLIDLIEYIDKDWAEMMTHLDHLTALERNRAIKDFIILLNNKYPID